MCLVKINLTRKEFVMTFENFIEAKTKQAQTSCNAAETIRSYNALITILRVGIE